MAVLIRLKLRPWPERVRNAYRSHRLLGVAPVLAFTEALRGAFTDSWLDIRRWRIWR